MSKSKKSKQQRGRIPIVGIGASAGGLAAIIEVLHSLPRDSNVAIVLIQHLARDHESLGPEILSRNTKIPVLVAENNMVVEVNHVYLIPPNFEMTLIHGRLKLNPLEKKRKGHQLVIDSFFRSLANDQKQLAIGVVLSGTATDGTQGLQAIKSVGGLTIVQDPNTAEYRGMPESAIASAAVDLVLSPQKIASELVRFAKKPHKKPIEGATESTEGTALQTIYSVLKSQMHIDFADYKQSTLVRRIKRRMMTTRHRDFAAYARFLRKSSKEVKDLYADIFIHVTQFFRDPKSFEKLRTVVFPQVVKNKSATNAVRIWVPGCSTGEEVYSIAIMLIEFLTRTKLSIPIQIFATDISEPAIRKARLGEYSSDIEHSVSKDRLRKFFEKTEKGYQVNQTLRDMCLFTKHDVSVDPPFSKLDLVSCRNVLIYFATDLQKRVIPLFHYALNPNGFLFLGGSESLGSYSKLFTRADKASKLYLKKDVPTPALHQALLAIGDKAVRIPRLPFAKMARASNNQRYADKIAISMYAPPSVTVSSDLEILQFQGRTAPYLEPNTGPPTNNLFKMVRPELLHNLRSAVHSSIKKNGAVRLANLSVEFEGDRKYLNIEVVPANPAAPPKLRNYVIFFEDETLQHVKVKDSQKRRPTKKTIRESRKDRIDQLEQQLFDSRRANSDLAKEFETVQEELTDLNEELQSTNEDLQSTNEEVETSKEELQSSNEELTTINDELQSRNADLVLLSSDLNNVLNSVEIPIVIVGKSCRIRRFTPPAQFLFNLIPGDIGRPLSDINRSFDLNLEALVKKAMKARSQQECEIQNRSGKWMRLQVRPIKTVENRVDGAVISLIDITFLKENLIESKSALEYAKAVADTFPLPLLVIDENLHLLSANKSFAKLFKIDLSKNTGVNIVRLLGQYSDKLKSIKKHLNDVIHKNREFTGYEVSIEVPGLGNRQFSLSANLIRWRTSMPRALLLSIEDGTERVRLLENEKKARALADQALGDAKLASETKDLFLATLSHELRTPLSSILSWAQLIQRSDLDPEKLKHGLETIERSAKAQGQLIEDLLDIARIQSGKLKMNFKDVNPFEPVNSTITALRPVAEKAGIKINFESNLKSEVISGDPERIQQMVWNLLSNAIKFSPGGSTIDVALGVSYEGTRKFVSIKVIDHGKGIKPDFLPKLFERFSQADNSSIRLHGGLGLGLALVRELSDLQGGKVRAESAGLNQGATFTILLPVKSTVARSSGNIAPDDKDSIEPSIPPSLSGICVMVVEDDVNTLDALTETLISFGAKVIQHSNAPAALNDFPISKPDLLVSDIGLPGEDGYSLIRKIRSLKPEQNNNIPALALTAYAKQVDINRALDAGFDDHMSKPFDTHKLGNAIAKLARSLSRLKSAVDIP